MGINKNTELAENALELCGHLLSKNAKLRKGLYDLRSQLIDGGTKEDSVIILSIDSLLNK